MCVCAPPPSTPPPLAALPLFLSSEGRCCLTHTRYTQTIGQTEREKERQRERAGRGGDGHGLPGREKHFHNKRGEQEWCDVRAERERGAEVWGGLGLKGATLITQHCNQRDTKTHWAHTIIKISTSVWRMAAESGSCF